MVRITTDDVKNILKNHYDRQSVCVALSYVNLSDNELRTLIYRYMRSLTQEQTAEKFGDNTAKNTVFAWQQSALEKTAKMWSGLCLAKILLKTIDMAM